MILLNGGAKHNPIDILLDVVTPFLIQPVRDLRLDATADKSIKFLSGSVTSSLSMNIIVMDIFTQKTVQQKVEPNGQFSMDVSNMGAVLVIAVQDGGKKWRANHELKEGEWIRPKVPNGRIYKVVTAGNTGGLEPSWWHEVSGKLGRIGTAQAEVFDFHEPKVHGPIELKEME